MIYRLFWKKAPYGVRTRVRGSDKTGYIVECAIYANTVPWLVKWSKATVFDDKIYPLTFASLSEANEHAQRAYDRWVYYFVKKEAEEAAESSQLHAARAAKIAKEKFLRSLPVVNTLP